jgi:hypothetical protein
MAEQQNIDDQDVSKGATEGDGRGRTESEQNGNTSLSGQNPHRTESRLVKANDSDFPEPGSNPEHSGQRYSTDQHGRPHQETGVAQRGSTLSHEQPGAVNESTRKAMRPAARDDDKLPRESPSEGADVNARRSPEREQVNQDPGHRQKQNQNESKDDPLAA